MPEPDAAARGEPPDFKAVVVEQFQALQSRIDDLLGQSPELASNARRRGSWRPTAARLVDDEVGELRLWLETRWNATPRDTAILMKLLKLIPGGKGLTRYSEAAPYLLAIALRDQGRVLRPRRFAGDGRLQRVHLADRIRSTTKSPAARATPTAGSTNGTKRWRHGRSRRRRVAGRPRADRGDARPHRDADRTRPRRGVGIQKNASRQTPRREPWRPALRGARPSTGQCPTSLRHRTHLRVDCRPCHGSTGRTLAIGLITLFYWARVLRLVRKAKKTTGRSANFLPPETLGAVLRIIWYPNVVAWVTVPLVIAFLRRPPAGLRFFTTALPPAWPPPPGRSPVLYLTMICWRKMGRDWRMGIDPTEQNTLIVSGPYAMVRHPIYALQCGLAALSFVAVPTVVMAVVCGLQCVLLQWEAYREERHMLRVHGDIYGDYMRQVGRFLPRGRYQAATP